MGWLRQSVGEHRLDLMLLGLADVIASAQLALGAGALRPEVVAQISLLPLDAALGRQLEALLRAAVRLHLDLGHARRGSISISPVWASNPWGRLSWGQTRHKGLRSGR